MKYPHFYPYLHLVPLLIGYSAFKLYFMYVCMYVCMYVFIERGREGITEGEKHQCVVASCTPPTDDLARNPATQACALVWEWELVTFWFSGRHSIH